jgi:radical SAM superfamily enzyme
VFDWIKETNVNDIAILDPTFNTDTAHASWILSKLPKSKVSLQIRPEKLNRRFLQAVVESEADIVLEMGVQTLIPNEMELIERVKGADPQKVVDKVKEKLLLAEEYNVRKEITLIYGLPRQSISSFMYTLDWCNSYTTAKVVSFPLMLLRGTPLYYKKDEFQLVEGVRHFTDEHRISDNIPPVISTATMSETDWWKMGKFSEMYHKGNFNHQKEAQHP